MMGAVQRLPIFEEYRPTPGVVELVAPLDRSALEPAGPGGKGRRCTLCVLGERQALRTPCITAEGQPGGLLVIGETATKDDDQVGRPFMNNAAQLVKRAVVENWRGPVAFDYAIRCAVTKPADVKEKQIAACRGYLRATIDEVQPSRIVVVGSLAAQGLFGRTVPNLTSRGAYAWLRGGDKPIPVFFVVPPLLASRNRFIRKWFDADMKAALTASDPPPAPWESEATVVDSPALARFAEKTLVAQRWVAFDVETTGTMWSRDFQIIATSLCGSDEDDVWLWPAAGTPQISKELFERIRTSRRFTPALFDAVVKEAGEVTAILLRILSSKLPKVGQNVKYDQLSFRAQFGLKVHPMHIDVRLQRKLLEPEADANLGKMAELVGMGGHKEEAKDLIDEVIGKIKRAFTAKPTVKFPDNRERKIAALNLQPEMEAALRLGVEVEKFMMALIPTEVMHRYNARDSVVTQKLALYMEREIAREPLLQRTWDVQVLPAARALERVEGWGVAASKHAINVFDKYCEQREITTKKVLDEYSGDGMNWNSVPQVTALLYERLGFQIPTAGGRMMTTDGGAPSTGEEALLAIHRATGHPLPKALIDYRFVTKLRGTYAHGMYPHIREDGRIHPNVKLDGARSGRTSCVDPNLQNIPRPDSPEGKMARDCFVAPPGFVLLEADYSQLELRVAAMLSGDKVMQDMFRSGHDFHLTTAKLISQIVWGIPPEEVTGKERSIAKTVVFGVLYGKTAGTFAKEWGVSRAKAEQIVEAIMGQFKQLRKWCDERLAEAQRTGVIWTWWAGQNARRRPLWQIASPDDGIASVARNGAVNTPIQGTASDYDIASLAQAVQWIEDDGIEDQVKLILPVHDSLMFEVHESMVAETSGVIHEIMTGHESMGVKLEIDMKAGRSWGSMNKHKIGGAYVEPT